MQSFWLESSVANRRSNKHRGGARRAWSTGLAIALSFLASCSSPGPAKPDETQVKQFVGQGYLSEDRYPITTTPMAWPGGEHPIELTLTLPVRPGSVPLVIYLPALGESHSAGESWRTAWSQAGYAVISIQPLAEDANAWSSPRARTGDFFSLGHERFGASAMRSRVAALETAVNELRRRVKLMEPPLDHIDLTRVAVAGYDLGAFTALAIAGESVSDTPQPMLSLPIQATIALSPYASFSGKSFTTRYALIHDPVLAITSDTDLDSIGLVTSPDVRAAPFQYMPGPDKYMLMMSAVTHSSFGGGTAPEISEKKNVQHDGEAGTEDSGKDQPPQERAGRRRQGGGGFLGTERLNRDKQNFGPGSEHNSPTTRAITVAAVQGVSTAFLDAYVKHDMIAREWLAKDANRWLKDRGELKSK